MKILICDDDHTTLYFLEHTLAKMGYEVAATHESPVALSILCSEDSPTIALLDWMMPELSGLEVIKMVRETKSDLERYLILFTRKDSPQDIADGLAAGASDYITKPFEPVELKARIELGKKFTGLRKCPKCG